MSEFFHNMFNKPHIVLRLFFVLFAQVIMGFAIALLRLPALGTDPFSAMMLGLTNHTSLSYGNFCALGNCTFFVIEIIWGRHYIGLGTLANWFLLGYCVDFACWVFGLIGLTECPASFPLRLLITAVGIIILGFSLSMYQCPDAGSSPYDCLPLILNDKFHIPFFAGRVLVDGCSTLVAWLSGGVIGIGTLAIFLTLGPVTGFFNDHLFLKFFQREQ